jgi:hypothetical protein
MDVPWRKKGKEGHRQQMVAISQEGVNNRDRHQRVELRTEILSEKLRNTLHNLQENSI